MKGVRLTIRASSNRDTRRDEHSVSRELPHGITLCGLRTLIDALVSKTITDTWYVTGIEVEPTIAPAVAMAELSFVVEGRPVPWERAGYNSKTKAHYKKPKSEAYQQAIRMAANFALHRAGYLRGGWKALTGPVVIGIRVYPPDLRHGDEDNYQKQVGDALQKFVYVDDKQVHWSPETVIEVDRKRPRLEVTVRWETHGGER